MQRYAIIFFILCKLAFAQENSKLSLLATEENVYCMNDASRVVPAIVLQTTNLSDIAQTKSKWAENSSLDCDFIYKRSLEKWRVPSDWEFKNIDSEIDVLPLLDYHWEDLTVNEMILNHILNSDPWDVTISIRAKENVNIILCDSTNSTCYHIILGKPKKDSQIHSIIFCPSDFQNPKLCEMQATAEALLLEDSKWVHVTISLKDDYLKLSLLEKQENVLPFLEAKGIKYKLHYLHLTAQGLPAQFRIHNYTFLGVHYKHASESIIESPEFVPTYYPLCISVLGLIWPGKKESLLKITILHSGLEEDLMTIHPLELASWQQIRKIHLLKLKKGKVKIRIKPEHTNYYLLGAVRECNPTGDVRVISMSTKSHEDSTFSCALLTNQNKSISKTGISQIKKKCKELKKCSESTTTCNKFSIAELGNCTNTLLCEQSSDCCCDPIYIKPCAYQDFGVPVNLTVASVAEGTDNDCIVTYWPDPCFAEKFTLTSKIKKNDSWNEVQTFIKSRERLKCTYWDNRLCYRWCALLNNLYMFQISYTISTPFLGEQYHQAETTASLNITGPPDPPLALKSVYVNADSINLTWSHPLITNGKLRYFEVKAEPLRSSLKRPSHWNTIIKNISISSYNKTYTFLVENLIPSTNYKISVCSHTNEKGNAATLEVSTQLAKPYIGPEFIKLQDSVTSTSVMIQLPPADRNLTSKSAYFLIGTSYTETIEKLENVTAKNELLKKINIKNEDNCWFAVELNLLQDGPKNYTVGDNSSSTGLLGHYWNRPLIPEMEFSVSLVAMNEDESHFDYEVKTLEFNLTATKNNNVILAVIIIVVMFWAICIALVAVLWYLRRYVKTFSSNKESLELVQEQHSGATDHTTEDRERCSPEPSLTNSLPDIQQNLKRELSQLNHSVLISDLEAYIKSVLDSGELEQQFSLLPDGLIKPHSNAVLQENKAKNRYQNIIPYDYNRVVLKRSSRDTATDYINASYIDGHNSHRFYIATQGPKQNTLIDFWRMIWQENVSVIAMATNITKNGKVVCEQYWPELQKEVQYGPFSVLNTFAQQLANFTFRIFCITLEGSTRTVHHLHFTSWSNHRVPYNIKRLATYLKKLLIIPSGTGPIVVHCSAGSGRTGTIILTDMCLRMAAAEGSVDVLKCMARLRDQRVKMVGNLDQYKLVHLVLLESLTTESTEISCDGDFVTQVGELYSTEKLHHQFEKLREMRWQNGVLSNPSLAFQSDAQNCENESLYHNLSDLFQFIYMDGFLVKDQFVVTGLPHGAVLEEFWKMVVESRVSLIIFLNDIDETANKFWPTEAQMLTTNACLRVEVKEEEEYPLWKYYLFQVNDISKGTPVICTVNMLHLKGWKPSCELPQYPETLLDLWEETQRRQQKGSGPIALVSHDISASGLFAALANVIEKLETENKCDICEAVHTVHANLDYFFITEDQFLFLHAAIIRYLQTYSIYANL